MTIVVITLIERKIPSAQSQRFLSPALMTHSKKQHSPTPAVIRKARLAAGFTQTEAAQTVRASLRGWQQWEAGDRTMPPGLFELFMLKTGQWPLASDDGAT